MTIHALWIVAALVSALTVFFDVAYRSILPSILPADELMEGNSRLTASASVAEFGAFSLGGWLVQLFSAPGAVLIDSFTFIWSAFWLRGLKMSEQVKPEEDRLPILHEIRGGIHLVWRNRTLRALAGYAATFEFAFNMFGAVFLIFLVREVGFSPGGLGVIFAIGGLSSIAGAATASRVTSALGLQRTIVVMSIIMAVGQGMVAFAMTVSVVSVGLLLLQQVLVDAPYTIVDVNTATIRQTSASEEWQGRLNATFRVLAFGGALLGTVAGGLIGEFIGLRVALITSSLVIASSAFWREISPVESWNPQDSQGAYAVHIRIARKPLNRAARFSGFLKGINVAEAATDLERFSNKRAEGYWRLREAFESQSIMIPDDDELVEEMTSLKYNVVNSNGTIKMEEKKKRKNDSVSHRTWQIA